MSPYGHDRQLEADRFVSTVMHATSLSSPRHLVQPAVSVSYSTLYFRIAVRHFSGWDPRVTQVLVTFPNFPGCSF
jgi:hypothetical protein